MPTVLTPQGWVKTAPAPRKKVVNHNPKASLRGPLAYLACQPQMPSVNVPNNGGVKGKAPFPYDLSASPEKLRRQNHQMANRTVSAPVMRGALHQDDERHSEEEADGHISSRHSKHKSKPRSSRHDHDHHHDNHSVTSSSRSSSSSSRSSEARSYTRHRPLAVVETRPPPSQPLPPSRNHYYSQVAPRYDQYMAPPPVSHVSHMSMPMPPSSGRSLSYSWYNATTPLNI